MAGVEFKGGYMTRMTVLEMKDIAKGVFLSCLPPVPWDRLLPEPAGIGE